jgi:hypothetical protein
MRSISTLLWISVGVVVWALLGSAIAAPYTWLSGGSWICFVATLLLGPSCVFLQLMVWASDNAYHSQQKGKDHWHGGVCSTVCLTYFCLPIILNGTSVVLQNADYETAAYWVLALRYWSLVIGLPFAVGSVVMIARVISWQSTDSQEIVPSRWSSPPPAGTVSIKGKKYSLFPKLRKTN